MKKKVVIMLLACSMALSFTACGGSSTSNETKTEQKAPEEKEYVDDINAVVTNPDSYKVKRAHFAPASIAMFAIVIRLATDIFSIVLPENSSAL